jgi:methyltransferase (TIGR00027 family)
MKSTLPSIQHVSDTAFWVASHRAKETEREDAFFRDPLAGLLVGEPDKAVSRLMKSVERYSYWTLVMRTCVIDEYIFKYLAQGYKTVINLGAGLDTRPYRLALPESTQWVEIDFPEIIHLKNEKLKNEKPRCHLERLSADLSNPIERKRIFSQLNFKYGPTIILTEGLIPYLSEPLVSELAGDIKAQSNFQIWIADYYSPHLYPRYQSEKFRKLLGDSAFQFFPKDWFVFFENNGWVKKEMRYLYDEGEKRGRRFPLPWWAKLLKLVFGEEKVLQTARASAYVIFTKSE